MTAPAPDPAAASSAPSLPALSPDLAERFAMLGYGDAALADLARWRDLLADWSGRMNLIGPRELPHFWIRHALDSAQLAPLADPGGRWIDLGAGAGFPGIAIAIAAKHARQQAARQAPQQTGAPVGGDITLVESVGKKSAFLRAVIGALALPARAPGLRYQDMRAEPYDVVTARAFAPLPRLFDAAHRFWGSGTIGLFPKGKGLEAEIRAAEQGWSFRAAPVQSITGDGAILRVTELAPK